MNLHSKGQVHFTFYQINFYDKDNNICFTQTYFGTLKIFKTWIENQFLTKDNLFILSQWFFNQNMVLNGSIPTF